MSNNPAFLLYSQDFLIGCAEMTHEEIGQYFRILCYLHQKGRMEEKTIRLLVGSVSANVKSKFTVDESDKWYNERLEQVIEERQKFVNSRKINGSLGGRPKEEKPIGSFSFNLKKPNEIEDEIEIEDKSFNSLYEQYFFEFVNLLPKEVWNKWIEYRKEIKHKLTKSSAEGQLKKLLKLNQGGSKPIDVINQSIENGWQGLFEVKNGRANSKDGAKPDELAGIVARRYNREQGQST